MTYAFPEWRRAVWLALVWAAVSTTEAAPRVPQAHARGLVVPVYVDGQSAAVATLRVGRVFKDTRRVGFFKVRLLPLAVAEGVHLEVLQPEAANALLDRFEASLLRLSGGEPFELRDFKITFPREAQPRLQARRAHPSSKGEGGLVLEGVTAGAAGLKAEWSRATLRLHTTPGLVLVEAGRQQIDFNLFTGSFTTNQSNSIAGSK